ncbi:MAG TPA: hypothetical protein VGX52_15975 [Burkholderiales bacterium]|nr:hypothetical protein [Burkholderiales bacterium]
MAIILLAFLGAACVRLGHIQQTQPVRTTKFTGSHTAVAKCIHQRIGGRLQDESFGERYVIYDSVKGQTQEGLTHYAITVGRTGADQGFAEWRVMRPARRADPASARQGIPPLTDAVVQQYWNPVRDCAAQAKGSQ